MELVPTPENQIHSYFEKFSEYFRQQRKLLKEKYVDKSRTESMVEDYQKTKRSDTTYITKLIRNQKRQEDEKDNTITFSDVLNTWKKRYFHNAMWYHTNQPQLHMLDTGHLIQDTFLSIQPEDLLENYISPYSAIHRFVNLFQPKFVAMLDHECEIILSIHGIRRTPVNPNSNNEKSFCLNDLFIGPDEVHYVIPKHIYDDMYGKEQDRINDFFDYKRRMEEKEEKPNLEILASWEVERQKQLKHIHIDNFYRPPLLKKKTFLHNLVTFLNDTFIKPIYKESISTTDFFAYVSYNQGAPFTTLEKEDSHRNYSHGTGLHLDDADYTFISVLSRGNSSMDAGGYLRLYDMDMESENKLALEPNLHQWFHDDTYKSFPLRSSTSYIFPGGRIASAIEPLTFQADKCRLLIIHMISKKQSKSFDYGYYQYYMHYLDRWHHQQCKSPQVMKQSNSNLNVVNL